LFVCLFVCLIVCLFFVHVSVLTCIFTSACLQFTFHLICFAPQCNYLHVHCAESVIGLRAVDSAHK
jgi:hypothetical protein